MGMYTGLRFKGIVKEEYRNFIEKLSNNEYDNIEFNNDNVWKYCKSINENTTIDNIIKNFGNSVACGILIPFGGIFYIDGWEDEVYGKDKELRYVATDEFDYKFDKNTGYWCFQCSLKNYDNQIGLWIENVAQYILQTIEHLEVKYEEWNTGECYDFDEDGVITCVGDIY